MSDKALHRVQRSIRLRHAIARTTYFSIMATASLLTGFLSHWAGIQDVAVLTAVLTLILMFCAVGSAIPVLWHYAMGREIPGSSESVTPSK